MFQTKRAWRPGWALLAVVALTSGCVPNREPRTGPVMAFDRGLIVSNSPTWTENLRPKAVNGELEIPYSIIAHNDGPGSYSLLLDRWTFELRGVRARVDCREHRGAHDRALIVRPNTQLRVDCVFRYSIADTQRIAGAAGTGQIKIWLQLLDAPDAAACGPEAPAGLSNCSKERALGQLELPYALFAGDF